MKKIFLLAAAAALSLNAAELKVDYSGKDAVSALVVSLSGAARPDGILVELYMFVYRLRKHHSTDPAVADRQSLVPVVSRCIIP